jgi:hypothetical protein
MNLGIVEDEGGGSDDGDAEAAALAAKEEADALEAQKALDDKAKSGISDSEAKLLKDVMAKKKALNEANDRLKISDDKLKAFDGIDPAKVRELMKAQQEAEDAKLVAQGNWDALKAQMATAHASEMTGVNARVAELQALLDTKDGVISELTIGTSFTSSEFIREELLLTPSKTRAAYGAHFGFEDGAIVGYDKPVGKEGRVVLVDASGEPLSFEDALRKLVDLDSDRDQILKSKVKQGSNSKTNVKSKVPDMKIDTTETGRGRITSALSDFLNPK